MTNKRKPDVHVGVQAEDTWNIKTLIPRLLQPKLTNHSPTRPDTNAGDFECSEWLFNSVESVKEICRFCTVCGIGF